MGHAMTKAQVFLATHFILDKDNDCDKYLWDISTDTVPASLMIAALRIHDDTWLFEDGSIIKKTPEKWIAEVKYDET